MVNPKKVQNGDIMAVIHWVKVVSGGGTNELKLHDLDRKQDFRVQGEELIASAMSADRYDKVSKVSRTKMVETLIASKNTPITAHYIKKDGTPRTVRCKWLSEEPKMGRSFILDLDKGGPGQIDHRSLQYLICDDVRYELKK